MKILFEEYAYETTILEGILPRGYYHQATPLLSKIYYVGYYNNSPVSDKGEAVVILPKIFLSEDEKLFGVCSPEQLLSEPEIIWKRLKEAGRAEALYSFSIWIFRAIQNYVRRFPSNKTTENQLYNQIINNTGDADHTELGLVLSLFRFFKDNRGLFTSVSKLQNAGRSKINWTKTSIRTNPIIQGKNIIFTDFVSKHKTVNFDEELLVIFYSVLNYYKDAYGFSIILETNYELITGHRFQWLLENGIRKLKSIKYKYFNDRFVKLWSLLYTFFEKADKSRSGRQFEEVLLVKDFNLVFEDMIDDLLSDDQLPNFLKSHKDGKELDHIYKDTSLFPQDHIYFIGDSKYYKPGNAVGSTSIAKQFTYAKNVIQYNIDLFHQGKEANGIRYRDELTEGYNISPNFFITAILDQKFDFSRPGLNEDASEARFSYHFKNRLFDRDSLYVQHYDINFLYVLSSYVSGSLSSKQKFKNSARGKFRLNLISYFNDHFVFTKVTPASDITLLVDKYFKKLIGKMYRSSDWSNSIVVAQHKADVQDLSAVFSDETGITITEFLLE